MHSSNISDTFLCLVTIKQYNGGGILFILQPYKDPKPTVIKGRRASQEEQ